MRAKILILLTMGGLLACENEAYKFSNEWLKEKRIYVYGTPPLDYLKEVNGSVIAWSVYHGGLNDEELDYVRKLHSEGIKVASNFPTMQASPSVVGSNDLEKYACKDINGNPVKALWIQPNSPYLPCHNNPEWQEFLKRRIREHIDGEVDAIHFDEIEGIGGHLYIAGFCEHCMRGFRRYLSQKFTPSELKSLFGIEEVENFDYREYLLSRGARGIFDDPNKKLAKEFVIFQLKSRKEQIEELIRYAREYAGRDIAFGGNLFFLTPNKQIFIEDLDFSVSENFIELPPDGKYMGTYLLTRAISEEKPFIMFPNIIDLKFMSLINNYETLPLRIMEAGAGGEGFLIPYRAYIFGGGLSTVKGTATAPPEKIRHYTKMLIQNPELFNGKITGEIGILYDFSCAIEEYAEEGYAYPYIPSGKVHTGSLGMALYLQKKHIPFRFIYEGDGDFVKKESGDINGLRMILVPYLPCETFDRFKILKRAEEMKIPVHFIPEGYRIWNGENMDFDFLKSEILSTDAGEDVGIVVAESDNKTVVHLINYDYSLKEGFRRTKPFYVRICGKEKGRGITMVPGGDPEEIEIKKENNCFSFLSPGFEIYRVVVIEHNQ
jgi:hypothetical protein